MNEGIWIPANVWALDLPPLHRVFLARVVALTSDKGGCFAGDEYLAGDLGCTPQYVRKMRKKLQSQGYLVVSGYGHKRKLTVELAPTGTSNHRNKQPQEQKLQPEAQDLQPEAQLKATTVAHTIDVTIEKNKEQSKEKPTTPKIEIVMPWESEDFARAWAEWKEYKRVEKRFTFKSPKTEQMSLHKLYENTEENEQLAIYTIGCAIANGWAGLHVSSQVKREFSGMQKRTGTSQLDRELEEFYATGKIQGFN